MYEYRVQRDDTSPGAWVIRGENYVMCWCELAEDAETIKDALMAFGRDDEVGLT